jgi:hypothetical protein
VGQIPFDLHLLLGFLVCFAGSLAGKWRNFDQGRHKVEAEKKHETPG